MRKWQRLFRGQVQVLLGLVLVASVGMGGGNAKDAVVDRLREDLKYLAGDECEGRGIYTKGLEKAATYIAGQFEKAGLKPGGVKDTYFQPFTITGGGPATIEKGIITLKGPLGQTIELNINKDFAVLGTSGSGKVSAPIVFAGYGITAPDIKYDDYEGLDVKGKVVIVLRKTPRWGNKEAPFDGEKKDQHAALAPKLTLAEMQGAAAVVLVNDSGTDGDKLESFADMAKGFSTSASTIPNASLKRDMLDKMMVASLGKNLVDVERGIDRDLKPQSAPLKGWTMTIETKVTRKAADVKNVVGVIPGHGPLAKEVIVIGAHYDHLGHGEPGSLAKTPEDKKKIHYGADDNASGSTAVMELARRFGKLKDWQGRTLVFMTFSGEEKGLLGSNYYSKHPLFPLDQTAAMVNLDMVGRMAKDKESNKGKLIAEGVGTGKGFGDMLDTFNKKYDFQLKKSAGSGGYSDHWPFYQKKIPIVFLWTGIHEDYHRPTDTWDKINYVDMARIVDMAEEIITKLATEKERPEYVYVPSPVSPSGGGPKLGFAPAYGDDVKGVLVDSVSPTGPAGKGGLKAGDIIIAINDKMVTNMTTYMAAMKTQKAGHEITVTVQRGKEKVMLKITPQ